MANRSMTEFPRRIGQALFRRDDKFAWRQGWQIQTGRLGLNRTYRHPGFERLTRCPDCHGSRQRGDTDCGRCCGTGRVALGRPFPTARG